IEEPEISIGLVAIGGCSIGLGAGARNAIGHGDGGAGFSLGCSSFDGAKGLSLGKVDDLVTERLHQDIGVIGKVSRGVAVGPATLVFERLRHLPMIHGDEGMDVGFVQLLENALVMVESLGIGGAGSIGLNARPTDGETI